MSRVLIASVVIESLSLSPNSITVTRIEKSLSVQIGTFQSAEGIITFATILVETQMFGIMISGIPEPHVIAFAHKMTHISRKFS